MVFIGIVESRKNGKALVKQFLEKLNSQQKRWVRALWEPLASVETNKSCTAIGNIQGDYDFKLLAVDFSQTPGHLKLFKGLSVISDSILSDMPSGIITFVCDTGQLDSPCVGVACGGSILIYRNMKPYYRYNIPQQDLSQMEISLWNRTAEKKLTLEELVEGLQIVRDEVSLSKMSFHSQQLLTRETDDDRQQLFEKFMSSVKDTVPLSNIQISCITTVKRNSAQLSGVDVIVVGTELGSIYWIDSQAYSMLSYAQIQGIPEKLLAFGQYDIDSKTVVCTRDGEVYILKKDSTKNDIVQTRCYMKSHVINIVKARNTLVFACRDRSLVFCSVKGKRLNEIHLEEDIIDIEEFNYEPRQYMGVLVALKQEVHVYLDQFLVDKLKIDNPIEWIKFGRLGREEGVLVIGTTNHVIPNLAGGLGVYIFRRTAVLEEKAEVSGAPPAQNLKLNVPKRTKIFVDQSLRERENPQKIHKIYQRDLFMLKLHTAKTFAELTSTSSGLLPTKESEPIDFNVDLHGFGPIFKLSIKMVPSVPLTAANRWIVFTYNKDEYSFQDRMIPVPSRLVPKFTYLFSTEILCLNPEKGLQEDVKVLLIRTDRSQPVWMATFLMPISEPNIL